MSATLAAPGAVTVPTESDAAPPRRRGRTARYDSAPSPWQRRDAVAPGVLAVAGVAVLAVGWVGASGEFVWRDQVGWLVTACVGTAVVVLGGALWLLVGFREVRRGFRDLRADQRRILGLASTPEPAMDRVSAVSTNPDGLVTSAGMTRAHRPDCLLMRGKPATAVPDPDRHARCGVCERAEPARHERERPAGKRR